MALRTRNILSLCAGVGGLDLGIQLALAHLGETGRGVAYVEGEVAAASSLVASMEAGWLHPAPIWSDVRTFDARPWRGVVHIVASGDPCQDNSVAGRGFGEDGERFLAPEVCRIAAECRPDLIFRENVPGNASGQIAAIVPALERLGYRTAAGIFSSAETGNTMRRERLFIMAERESIARGARDGRREGRPEPAGQQGRRDATGTGGADMRIPDLASASDPRSQGQQPDKSNPSGRKGAIGHAGLRGRAVLPPAVIPGPTDSRWINVLNRWPELQPALSAEEAESHLRRGVDAMAHRIERLRATGNGVDPMVAAYAFLSLGALLDAERARSSEPVLMGMVNAWPSPKRSTAA